MSGCRKRKWTNGTQAGQTTWNQRLLLHFFFFFFLESCLHHVPDQAVALDGRTVSRPSERRNTARWREEDTKHHSSLKYRRRNRPALAASDLKEGTLNWSHSCSLRLRLFCNNKTTSGLSDAGGSSLTWRRWTVRPTCNKYLQSQANFFFDAVEKRVFGLYRKPIVNENYITRWLIW